MSRVRVQAATPALQARARALAETLGLGLDGAAELYLTVTPERLELREAGQATGPVCADFTGGACAHRLRFGGGRGQAIARAVGLRGGANPHVLDATAGLGRDAFVLASLGCRVTLLERSPVVAALLEDGLRRAAGDPATADIVARMTLHRADARAWLAAAPAAECGDVVYLDPMFPPRGKTAQVKKEMRLFHALIGQDADSDALLACALGKAGRRVVVKRPRRAPALDGPAPTLAITGKSTRYDVYVIAALGLRREDMATSCT